MRLSQSAFGTNDSFKQIRAKEEKAMLNFTDKDRTFIRQNFSNFKTLLNAEKPADVLDPLYDLIDAKGFAPPKYED